MSTNCSQTVFELWKGEKRSHISPCESSTELSHCEW